MYALFLLVLFFVFIDIVLTLVLTFYLLNKMHKAKVGAFQLLMRKNLCACTFRFTSVVDRLCFEIK